MTDRHFVFVEPHQPDLEIKRRPALDLSVSDLTGLALWPEALAPQQLALPFLSNIEVTF